MQQSTADNTNKNIIVGPDYGQIVKLHTNGAIIDACIAMLFSKNMKFNFKSSAIMFRNIIILLAIKLALEDLKSFLDKFKFTNLSSVQYLYQRFWYSEKLYKFNLVCGKWYYNDKVISLTTLTPFLEQKSVFISQPGTYYYEEKAYLIKVIIDTTKITFAVPDIASILTYIEYDVIKKNEENIIGGKTTMYKAHTMSSGVIKLESTEPCYACPTENYIMLENSIKNDFFVGSATKKSSIPFCVNFDGKPGTGKTTFGDYIALSGIFDRIIVCNFVPLASTEFQDAISNLERQIVITIPKDRKPDAKTETILLILDEIDKWLANYLDSRIHKLREEARPKRQIKDDKNNVATVIESYDKLTLEEENEKRIQLKNEFLNQFHKLVDGLILSDARRYVIIFNTNDFTSIFKDADPRYDATKDRIQGYKFSKITKPEIIKCLKCLNDRLKNYYSTLPSIEKEIYAPIINKIYNNDDSIYDSIPPDIEITNRNLHFLSRKKCHNIAKTVKSLAKRKNIEYLEPIHTDLVEI